MTAVLAALAIAAAFLNLAICVYFYRLDPGRLINRLFAVFAGLMVVACLGEAVVITANDQAAAVAGARIVAVQWCLTPALFIHFAMALGGFAEGKRSVFLPFIYLLYGLLVVLALGTDLIIEGAMMPQGFFGVYQEVGGALYLPANALVLAGDLFGVALVTVARSRSTSRAERRSMTLFISAALFGLMATTVTFVILPALNVYLPPSHTYVSPVIAILIGYAITRYDFMTTVSSALGRAVISSISDAVLVVDDRGVVEKANRAAEELTGFTEVELAGGGIGELFAGAPTEPFAGPGGEQEEWLLVRHASGELVPVSRSDGAVRSRRGNVLGSVVVLHDMREAFRVMRAEREAREAAEAAREERRRSEALEEAHREVLERTGFLQAILDNLAQPVFIKNRRLEFVYANRALLDVLGLPEERVRGTTSQELLGERGVAPDPALERGVLEEDGAPEVLEFRLEPPGGVARTFMVLETPLPGAGDRPEYIIGVMSDVTDQKLLERERLDFIRVAAHELRTPLTSLWLGVGLLARELRGRLTEEEGRSLEVLELSTERLVLLARNLLDLASLDAGVLALDVQDVEAAGLVAEVAALFEARLREKGLGCSVECDDGATLARADPARLTQVLTNLVDNAVKFTGSGAVTLAVRDGGDGMLEFSVSDTGCGIEHARLKTVFARFSRSGAGAGDGEGTGLGLSIARSIVEAHGGRMWAESAPGEGARFSFTVPRGDARPGAPG